ncbi:MAG: hypothetical protein ABI782_10905 [Anaerolineaceae bacterium]
MTILPVIVHDTHEWVVDLTTHRVRRRACPACLFDSAGPVPSTVRGTVASVIVHPGTSESVLSVPYDPDP